MSKAKRQVVVENLIDIDPANVNKSTAAKNIEQLDSTQPNINFYLPDGDNLHTAAMATLNRLYQEADEAMFGTPVSNDDGTTDKTEGNIDTDIPENIIYSDPTEGKTGDDFLNEPGEEHIGGEVKNGEDTGSVSSDDETQQLEESFRSLTAKYFTEDEDAAVDQNNQEEFDKEIDSLDQDEQDVEDEEDEDEEEAHAEPDGDEDGSQGEGDKDGDEPSLNESIDIFKMFLESENENASLVKTEEDDATEGSEDTTEKSDSVEVSEPEKDEEGSADIQKLAESLFYEDEEVDQETNGAGAPQQEEGSGEESDEEKELDVDGEVTSENSAAGVPGVETVKEGDMKQIEESIFYMFEDDEPQTAAGATATPELTGDKTVPEEESTDKTQEMTIDQLSESLFFEDDEVEEVKDDETTGDEEPDQDTQQAIEESMFFFEDESLDEVKEVESDDDNADTDAEATSEDVVTTTDDGAKVDENVVAKNDEVNAEAINLLLRDLNSAKNYVEESSLSELFDGIEDIQLD